MKVDGRCHCGQITYTAVVDPETVTICHCSDCQMFTGSVYRVAVPATRETFQLYGGTPKTYIKTADSGTKRVHAFCANCGTPVYSAAVGDAPPAYSLRVGCLRQRSELKPRRQQWCQSALPWASNLEAVPNVSRQ